MKQAFSFIVWTWLWRSAGVIFCSLLILLGWPAGLGAATVTWTVSGGTFEDGGVVTGSFTYDSVTFVCSSWSMSVSGGNTATIPAFTYAPGANQSCAGDGTVLVFTFDNGSSNRRLRMVASS